VHSGQADGCLGGVDDRSICEATLFDLPVTWRNPRRFWWSVSKLPAFVRDWIAYSRSAGAEELPVRLRYLYPILEDLGDEAGVASGHYFHQDLWAARKVFARRPVEHVDVGSRIDGFVAHLLTFML